MILVTLERVISAMRSNDMAFWVLKDGRTEVERMQNPETSVDASIEMLKEVMSQITGQSIDITISDKCHGQKSTGGRSYKNYEYKIKLVNNGVYGNSQDMNQGSMISLLKQIGSLEAKLIEQKYQAMIDKLNEKVESINGNKAMNPMLEKGLEALIEMAGRLDLPFLKKPQGALAGPPAEPQEPKEVRKRTKEEDKIIVDAIKVLISVDPDFINTIQKLASFARNNPDKYLSFIPMIPN